MKTSDSPLSFVEVNDKSVGAGFAVVRIAMSGVNRTQIQQGTGAQLRFVYLLLPGALLLTVPPGYVLHDLYLFSK